MRNITVSLVALICIAACEKIPDYELQIEGDGVAPYTEYLEPWESPDSWIVEDDWHQLVMTGRVSVERLSLYVSAGAERTDKGSAIAYWEGNHLLTLDASTDCSSETQYFDNPGNSFANNFMGAEAPEVYGHVYSPKTSAPDVAAILTIKNCIDPEFNVLITVLDDMGEPARTHQLKISTEEVGSFYRLFFEPGYVEAKTRNDSITN